MLLRLAEWWQKDQTMYIRDLYSDPHLGICRQGAARQRHQPHRVASCWVTAANPDPSFSSLYTRTPTLVGAAWLRHQPHNRMQPRRQTGVS